MSGKKYKLKITNVGVGDPFLLIKARFENFGDPPGGGIWSEPTSGSPVVNFKLQIAFCGGDTCGTDPADYHSVGSINVDLVATGNYYYFGLPFDQGNFQMGSNLRLMLQGASNNPDDLFYIYGDNLGADHLTYVQELQYSNEADDFDNTMVYYKWHDT
ncbi:MAG: hypothetical protein AAF998_17035 [Bacteroidota bacterium]